MFQNLFKVAFQSIGSVLLSTEMENYLTESQLLDTTIVAGKGIAMHLHAVGHHKFIENHSNK